MSNLIGFLERAGQDAQLRYATKESLDAALTNAGIAADARAAVLSGDHDRLAKLTGATRPVCCCLSFGDEDEAVAKPSTETATRNAA